MRWMAKNIDVAVSSLKLWARENNILAKLNNELSLIDRERLIRKVREQEIKTTALHVARRFRVEPETVKHIWAGGELKINLTTANFLSSGWGQATKKTGNFSPCTFGIDD